MKTATVRILQTQLQVLEDAAQHIPGASPSGLVQDAVATFIECELPVWLAKAKEIGKRRPTKVSG